MAEGGVTPGVLDRSVTRGPVHRDQRGEDADQEQDQHHVLREPYVLLLDPGRPPAREEVVISLQK